MVLRWRCQPGKMLQLFRAEPRKAPSRSRWVEERPRVAGTLLDAPSPCPWAGWWWEEGRLPAAATAHCWGRGSPQETRKEHLTHFKHHSAPNHTCSLYPVSSTAWLGSTMWLLPVIWADPRSLIMEKPPSLPLLFQSSLARSACMCIAHCSSRTVLGRKLTTLFQIVLQQMLTDAEVSSQEGCIQKVGKLVLRLLPSC